MEQIAPKAVPNPWYRRIGPKSEISNVRGNQGQLYYTYGEEEKHMRTKVIVEEEEHLNDHGS